MYKCLNCGETLGELLNPGDYFPTGVFGCSTCRYPTNRYSVVNRKLVRYEVEPCNTE